MGKVYQIKISLDYTKPPVWRRLLVPGDITFFKLHHILQIAMGWANYHLFEFKITGYRIGEIDEEMEDFGFGRDKLMDCRTTKLTDLLTGEKTNFKYYYDFGDSWTHTVTVEKTMVLDKDAKLPVCLTGKLNCPPEDCGGIPGFYEMLRIISNKRHKEHKEMLEWLGGEYDPLEFDIEIINDELADIDTYIEGWDDSFE